MPGRSAITSVPRVAIDLETTGLHPEQDAIIEIGAVKFAGTEVLETFESFVAPNLLIPYRVQRLTGITSAQLKEALTLNEVLPKLRTFIGELPLVGHSVPFDAAFLRRVGLARRNPLIDTFELASALFPGLPSYTLGAVGVALGVKSPTYHRALADAQLSMDVFLALLQRLETLDASTIEGLGRIAAPPDWTPAYFVRNAVREQRVSLNNLGNLGNMGGIFAGMASSSLGDQLSAKLGMDPAVLSLAIKPENPPARMRLIPSPIGVAPTPTTQEAQPDPENAALDDSAASGELAPTLSLPQVAAEVREAAQRKLEQTISVQVQEALTAGAGPLLLELQNDGVGAIACLASALSWTQQQQRRLLISVADNDSLSRLTQRTLPCAFAAANLSPDALTVAEVVEREAYLCLHRWFGAARLPRDGVLTQEMARGLAKLTVWVGQTETGARGEISLGGQEAGAWERVQAGANFADSAASCNYQRNGYCFVARAQAAAQDAQVVLTTHVALARYLDGADTLMPTTDRVLVLDANLLEEELRRARSHTLEQAELLTYCNELAEIGADGKRGGLLHLAAQRLEAAAKGGGSREKSWFTQVEQTRQSVVACFAALHQLLLEAQGENSKNGKSSQQNENIEQRMLRLDNEIRQYDGWQEAVQVWNTLNGRLAAVAKLVREIAQQLVALHGKKASIASDGIATDLLGSARLFEHIRQQGAQIFSNSTDGHNNENMVHWLRLPYPNVPPAGDVAQGRRGRIQQHQQHQRHSGQHNAPKDANEQPTPAAQAPQAADTPTTDQAAVAIEPVADDASELPVLHSAPVQVGQALASLYAPERGLILAAPSLAVSGDFSFASGALNLPPTTQTLGPMMDRSQQTLLCLPTDVPEPNAPQYQRHLDDMLIRLATTLNGDLVVVFPSHAALRNSANNVRRALERQRIMLMAQGQDGSVRQLWQAFRSESRVVLLGAGAFWDGAEQVERPPACVVITRVPFPALSDPLLAARADLYDDPQSQFVVPHAALKLRQALGGLAWSHWRRNAVVLFDRRLQTRGYGATILGTLPRCTQYQEPVEQIVEHAEEWVQRQG